MSFTLFLAPAYADSKGWKMASVKPGGANLRRSPNPNAEVLGHYPERSQLRIFLPEKNGFYAVYFREKWKDVNNGWIAATEIDLAGIYIPYSENVIRVGATGFQFNPSSLQSVVADAGNPFMALGALVEYEHRIYKRLAASISLGYYTFQQPVEPLNVSSVYYSANGFTATLAVIFYILETHRFSLAASAEAGISINTAGNSTLTNNYFNNNVLGYPVLFQLMANYRFTDEWGIYLKGGYQIHSLSGITVVPFSGQLTQQTVGSVSLNAPVLNLGFSYSF